MGGAAAGGGRRRERGGGGRGAWPIWKPPQAAGRAAGLGPRRVGGRLEDVKAAAEILRLLLRILAPPCARDARQHRPIRGRGGTRVPVRSRHTRALGGDAPAACARSAADRVTAAGACGGRWALSACVCGDLGKRWHHRHRIARDCSGRWPRSGFSRAAAAASRALRCTAEGLYALLDAGRAEHLLEELEELALLELPRLSVAAREGWRGSVGGGPTGSAAKRTW